MPNSYANILGDKIKEAREKASLTREGLAKQACLSVRQLEQIEGGGDTCFYSAAIKLASAKRIANILGMVDEEYLER
jgi:transcriptional regulator with XRE-family HTH domain